MTNVYTALYLISPASWLPLLPAFSDENHMSDRDEAPSTRYVENSDQRLHLLLSFCLSLLQLHTLCTPAL